MTVTRLTDRAVIRLTATEEGEDVREFLQGLVTNDVTGDLPVYAALLSAQGKAMFDFIVWPGADGSILLDCEAVAADDLVKRLSLYRLRRKITIEKDASLGVFWSLSEHANAVPDPRLPELGFRALAPAHGDEEVGDGAWFAHRLSLGVPEGYAELHEILWLETNAIELNGVDFEKGCYIGQENTARMNWRQKVNRRLVVIPLENSTEKRRKAAYPSLGLAVDHLRIGDIDQTALPDWQRAAFTAD